MKRFTALLLTMLLLITTLIPATTIFAVAGETNGITITLDGKVVNFPDAQPYIDENNRTLVPIRFVSEAMGAKVSWADTTSTVTIVKGEDTIIYPIGNLEATLNGKAVTFDTTGIIKDGRTFVPIAFIGRLLKCSVNWAQETKTVVVSTYSSATKFNLENGRVILNNGIEMPIVGIGTFTLRPEQAEESVYQALKSGYRLIDTARAYNNEEGVGKGIAKSGVPRKEIFLTTKLWPNDYDNADKAIDDALKRLGVEYIDLLLLHQAWGNYVGAYQAMEKAVRDGKVRAIGLSNFYPNKFDNVMNIATITPAVLQNERNPYFQQGEMQKHIKPYGTVLMDWFPLGGRSDRQKSLFEHETILEIAKAHGKSAAQVILRWHIQSGGIAIPGSSNPAHILENITIFDFALTDEEMQKISTLDTGIPAFDFSATDSQPDFRTFQPPTRSNAQE